MTTTPRFIVDAETAKDHWVNVYKGNNEQEAIRTANFWDERVNVRYRDVVREALIEQVRAEAEAERVASLPISEQFEVALSKVHAQIEENVNKALTKLETVR